MAKQAANDIIKTRINGNWPGVTKVETKPTKVNIDFSAVKKTRAPFEPYQNQAAKSKYDSLFKGAKEGDCWETKAKDVRNLGKGLGNWLVRNKIDGIVKVNACCSDGVARVWLWKIHQKRKAA